MSKQFTKREIVFLSIMLVAMIFWGASWVSAKLISGQAAPKVIVFWRLLLTFVSFFPIALILKVNLKLKPKNLMYVLAGGFLLAIYNQLFFFGLEKGLAGKGGIIVTTLNPLFTFMITIIILKHSTSRWQIFGLALGLTGGFIILEIWQINMSKLLASGNIFFIASALVWAVLTITSQYAQKDMSGHVYSVYVYGISAVISFLFALQHDPFEVLTLGADFWLHISFLSVIVISFATTAYFIASKNIGANRTSAFTFLVPFTALSLSWKVLGEELTLPTIIGGVLAFTAIYIIARTGTINKDRKN